MAIPPLSSRASHSTPPQSRPHSGRPLRFPSLSFGGPNRRRYRLVDLSGQPHPILDDLYDSMEAAWKEAESWWRRECETAAEPVGIGIEVSTRNGNWRTLRHPSC